MPPAAPLSVIQRFNVLCDCSQFWVRRDDLQITAPNSLETQFALFGYRFAPDKASKLRKEAPLTSDE